MVKHKKKTWQIIAICVSFVLFVTLLYINHATERFDYMDQLNKQSTLIRQSFDKALEQLVDHLPALTKEISSFNHCTKKTIDLLGEFSFTHSQLSTIAVKDNQNGWCISPEFRTLAQSGKLSPGKKLMGPVANAKTRQSYFILQYPGDKDITYHLYLLKSVLMDAINTKDPIIENVTLMTKDGTTLLQTHPMKDSLSGKQLSLESSEPSALLPDLLIHIDGNEAYIHAQGMKRITSLHLFSLAIAALFLIAILMQINRSFSMNGLIKQALRNHEFYPVFQPVFDATTHDIIGVELLARWLDRYGEEILPAQFIEEAEQSGHIVPITVQLITQAFKQLGDYLRNNRSFHLSVNLCRDHFIDDNWMQTLQMLCRKNDIFPEQIILEITERTMIDNTEVNLAKRMRAIHDAGFELAIDDFGTSHASISYLRHFPLDYLKIDMMYIHAIGTGAVTEALITPIILIANQLKLKIIAEGVETAAQLRYLKDHKVDLIQGWYFAKAMDAQDLLTLLEEEA